MNIAYLPAALTDKIHDHIYQCSDIGLTSAPCEPNQITLTTSNYVSSPSRQNVPTCCRNLHQMQHFFHAQAQGFPQWKARIKASLRAEEATNAKINELLTFNQQAGHFELVQSLLGLLAPNSLPNVNADAWVSATRRPSVLLKLLIVSQLNTHSALNALYFTISHAQRAYPKERDQIWKLRTTQLIPSLATVPNEILEQFFHTFRNVALTDEWNIFQTIKRFQVPLSSNPGSILTHKGLHFEHCDFPSLIMLLHYLNLTHANTLEVCDRICHALQEFLHKSLLNSWLPVNIHTVDSFWNICKHANSTPTRWSRCKSYLRQVLIYALSDEMHALHDFILMRFRELNYTIDATDVESVFALGTHHRKLPILTRMFTLSSISTTLLECTRIVKSGILQELFEETTLFLEVLSISRFQETPRVTVELLLSHLFFDRFFDRSFHHQRDQPRTFWNGVYTDHAIQCLKNLFDKTQINTQHASGPKVRTVHVSAQQHLPFELSSLRQKLKQTLGIQHLIRK